MFTTWEEMCFRVFQKNSIPIPKCLWYYKIKYTQRGEDNLWRSFFHNTPFQVWGYIGEDRQNCSDESRQSEKSNTREALSPTDPKTKKRPPPTPPTALSLLLNPNPPRMTSPPKTRTSDGTGNCLPPTSPTVRVKNFPTKKKKELCVYYQNVRGLCDEENLEYLSRLMDENNIDAFILTKMHLEGDFQILLPHNQLFIHHGREKQPPLRS